MQKEGYDIEKVKEYFVYFSYPNVFNYEGNIKDALIKKVTRSNYVVIENAIGVFFVSIFIIYFLIIAIFLLPLWGKFLSVPTLLYVGYLWTVFSIKEIKKSWSFTRLNKYFSIRSPLPSFLEKLKKSINKDVFSDSVDPITIDEIEQNMKEISKLLSLLTGPLIEFRKLGPSLPDEIRIVLEKFIQLESDWITEYIGEFRETLKTWMEVHQSELTEHQKNNLLSKNEEVYTLASSRLSSHIENLEKVRARL